MEIEEEFQIVYTIYGARSTLVYRRAWHCHALSAGKMPALPATGPAPSDRTLQRQRGPTLASETSSNVRDASELVASGIIPIAGNRNRLYIGHFTGADLCRRWRKRSLRSGLVFDEVWCRFNNTALFTQQVFNVVTAAHTRSCDLLIQKAMSHGGYADCRGRTSVLSEKERFGTTLRACLLSRGRQLKRRLTGALTNEHFNV